MLRGLFRLTHGGSLGRGVLQVALVLSVGALSMGVTACDQTEGAETGLEGEGGGGGKPSVKEKEYCFEMTCNSGDGSRDEGICAPSACERDDECPSGLNCEDGACRVPPCIRDTDCDSGLICDNEVCMQPPCKADSDCGSDQICEGEQCRDAPCKEDADCDDDLICDDASGACVPAPCKEDADCTDGWVCDNDNGNCMLPACTEDADCPAEFCVMASDLSR